MVIVPLVGHAGSGKSTVVNLIQRFYDPRDGAVKLDGGNIKELRLSWYRQQIGYLSNITVLLNATIRENLLIAKPDAD